MHSNGSPQQLTPRSKIRAMVAAVDQESGSEATQEPPHRQPIEDSVSSQPPNIIPKTLSENWNGESSEDDSEASPIVPRGRLAARLHDLNHVRSNRHENLAVEAQSTAYERIRKQFLSVKDDDHASLSQASSPRQSTDNEDAGPVIARRRRKRQVNSPSSVTSSAATPSRSCRLSPGLFLTPGQASASGSPKPQMEDHDSDSDLPADPQKHQRFLALVARKRAEREAKQAAEAEKTTTREARLKEQCEQRSRVDQSPLGESEDDSADNAGAKRLTQQARPTRKASKKALEEMNRETQRMNRNMQLAHQAKTKRKVTKESLFARFNFRTAASERPNVQQALSSSTAASSMPASDAENGQNQGTPPSSPFETSNLPGKLGESNTSDVPMDSSAEHERLNEIEDELPGIEDIMTQPQPKVDKGKAAESESTNFKAPAVSRRMPCSERPFKVRLPRPRIQTKQQETDPDSDLEILPARKSKGSSLDIFNRLPAKSASEARSLQTLRALAHLNSPPAKQGGKSKSSMTMSEMQMSLQQRARLQAAAERAAKIQELKNRGVILQTAEERQKDQAEIEDLVEKARNEAEAIKKLEKDAVRKENRANGGQDALDDSSDEDEDYQENATNESDVELSGSDEEQAALGDHESGSEQSENEAADQDEGDGGVKLSGSQARLSVFIEDEATEDSEAEGSAAAEAIDDANEAHEDEPELSRKQSRVRASRIIDSDDEAEDMQTGLPESISPIADAVSKPEIPGLAIPGPALPMMGMTQAFAATMAETQTQTHDSNKLVIEQEQDSLSFLGAVPEPNFHVFDANDTGSMILDSQDASNSVGEETVSNPTINLQYSQSQIQYNTAEDSQNLSLPTEEDDIPDPTQDVGFGMSSPVANRFISAPPSTIETVLLPGAESPLKKKKGRLQRGNKAPIGSPVADEDDTIPPHDAAAFEITANAFHAMKRKRNATPALKPFDKRKSEAKEMVEDQALESEDEYAGLGGASDDESGGSEDEEVRRMIEHENVDVDEGKLAAFYADKERTRDTAAISKLYKDITYGGLRRNRGGADFDLSDSDDDAEARHRAKRHKEAKLRNALLEDERIGKIAEDPKKLAFIRAIEDREEEDGIFLYEPEPSSPPIEESTQERTSSQSAEQAGQKRKRPLSESVPDAANRPSPASRRTKGKKPSTLAEIRDSVSFLIETPDSASFVTTVSSPPASDDENDAPPLDKKLITINEEATAAMPPPPARNPRRTGSAAFTDRLALLRSSTSASSSTRLAFAPNDAQGSNSNFRVPSLLRRATTSNLTNTADSNGISHLATTEQGAGGEHRSVVPKKGGRKGCSILGAAREVERRAVVEGLERKRREERERIARVRRSGMSAFGATAGWEA